MSQKNDDVVDCQVSDSEMLDYDEEVEEEEKEEKVEEEEEKDPFMADLARQRDWRVVIARPDSSSTAACAPAASSTATSASSSASSATVTHAHFRLTAGA